MINVFFVPGMFGTTIEYVLRNFTEEHNPIDAFICSDGSMHSFKKEAHFANLNSISFGLSEQDFAITTPIYPFKDAHLPEIIERYHQTIDSDYNILLYADSIRAAELNILFQFYKIAQGKVTNRGLDIFSGGINDNILQWNTTYKSWRDMKRWEWREWFSLSYIEWISEWQISKEQVTESFLKIKNTDLLFNTEQTFYEIIDFCNLTPKHGIKQFADKWQAFQQYIVDEFDRIDQIITYTVECLDYSWPSLSIVSEAIIQQKLRSLGYEIQCNSLDIFPTDAKTLYSLLIKC